LARLYETRRGEVDSLFGRPIAKYSHNFVHENVSYTVFCFEEKAEADQRRLALVGGAIRQARYRREQLVDVLVERPSSEVED
jgi:hypothetical protein